MSTISQTERMTQDRVIELFNWQPKSDNLNINPCNPVVLGQLPDNLLS